MVQRTIKITLDPTTGETTIDVSQFDDRILGRVTIRPDGDHFLTVSGTGNRAGKRTSDIETAFRLAMRAAVNQVTEELLD